MSDPQSNGNGTGPSLPEAGEAYSPEEVAEILDSLMDAMEALSEQVAAPQMTFTAEQRARLGDLFLVRYAIQSGVPPAAALHIAGFDVDMPGEEGAVASPPPQLSQAEQGVGNGNDEGRDQQPPPATRHADLAELQVLVHGLRGKMDFFTDTVWDIYRELNAARRASVQSQPPATRHADLADDEDRALLREALALVRSVMLPEEDGDSNALEDPNTSAHSDDTAAEPAADGEAELVSEADGDADDAEPAASDQGPDPTRHRTRGRAVRDERADASGTGDEGEHPEPVQ